MRNLVFIVLATCLLLSGRFAVPFIGSDAAVADGRPALDVALLRKNLQSVTGEQVYRVDFRVRNSGDRRLVIRQLGDECQCKPDSPRVWFVLPGEERSIHIMLDTRSALGRIDQVVEFATNDPTQPHFQLTVVAEVETGSMLSTSGPLQDFSVLQVTRCARHPRKRSDRHLSASVSSARADFCSEHRRGLDE